MPSALHFPALDRLISVAPPSERPTDSALLASYQDFLLAKALLSPRTVEWYQRTVGDLIAWLEIRGVNRPEEIRPAHVRAWIVEHATRARKDGRAGKVSDQTVNAFARGARAFARFLVAEGYRSAPVPFKVPPIARKRFPALRPEEITLLLGACRVPRDRFLLMLFVDSGLRLSEACDLRWGDVDMATGLVRVLRGKGGKERRVVVGNRTRQALLRYRRGVHPYYRHEDPLLQGHPGQALSPSGVHQAFRRLHLKTGIRFSAHTLRRTFATLCLRAEVDVLHLQALMGHASLEMTRRYCELLDVDLVSAHTKARPVDRLILRS